MKERERRALAQDYPKDFLSDSEWDFIESLATCKGDGIKNRSKTKSQETAKEVGMANSSRTVAQEAAFNAGIGFASGKANQRMAVKPENQDAFRDGVKKGRSVIAKGKAAKPATQSKVVRTREDKIKYYSARIDDPKLREGQRKFAARRLSALANQ